jgi:hypothetical protein
MVTSTARNACSSRLSSSGRLNSTRNGPSPAEQWARRKRQQKMLALMVAVALVAAQAYGWLFILRIV